MKKNLVVSVMVFLTINLYSDNNTKVEEIKKIEKEELKAKEIKQLLITVLVSKL